MSSSTTSGRLGSIRNFFAMFLVISLAGCGGASEDSAVSEVRSLIDSGTEVEVVDRSPDTESTTTFLPEAESETLGAEPESESTQDNAVVDTETDSSPEPVQDDIAIDTGSTPEGNSALQSVTLSWTPSAYYEDGTTMTLADISHFQVYYGNAENDLSQVVEVPVTGLNSYNVTLDSSVEWYVAVRTVSVYGGVSDFSNLVHLTL